MVDAVVNHLPVRNGRRPGWLVQLGAAPAGAVAARCAIESPEEGRFGAVGEFADGSPVAPAEDAGEIDGDGRIAVLYAFPGPLPAI